MRGIRALALACVALCAAGVAQAQSAYACRGLETHAALPAVEGAGGAFFAIRPELQAHHGMADETVAHVAALSRALAARGTVLVYMPVPTRAQVMAHRLPVLAAHLGYDPDAATAVHVDMVARLRAAGVTVADARGALRAAALAGQQPFFDTDPRPTAQGARLLAQSVAAALDGHPAMGTAVRGAFTARAEGEVSLPSIMRVTVQLACQSALPAVRTTRFVTHPGTSAVVPDGAVVVGTGTTATAELNLPGFISAATGLRTQGYGVAQGGAFAAISTYLTSLDFHAAPPRVLIWEVPVAASLAAQGDQPMRELITAAAQNCTVDIPLQATAGGDVLRADLAPVPLEAGAVLALDTGGAGLTAVRFHFTGADDLRRTRSIYRHTGQVLTGQFYLPVSGLVQHGLGPLDIQAPAAFGPQPRLRACY